MKIIINFIQLKKLIIIQFNKILLMDIRKNNHWILYHHNYLKIFLLLNQIRSNNHSNMILINTNQLKFNKN